MLLLFLNQQCLTNFHLKSYAEHVSGIKQDVWNSHIPCRNVLKKDTHHSIISEIYYGNVLNSMFGILAYHAGMFQRESHHSIISAIYYGNVLNSMFGILAGESHHSIISAIYYWNRHKILPYLHVFLLLRSFLAIPVIPESHQK